METVWYMISTVAVAALLAVLALLLRANKMRVLAAISELVQRAEAAVEGSGMGAEKKRLVIAQLEAMGVRVTAAVSEWIDRVVAELNDKSGWFMERKLAQDP